MSLVALPWQTRSENTRARVASTREKLEEAVAIAAEALDNEAKPRPLWAQVADGLLDGKRVMSGTTDHGLGCL